MAISHTSFKKNWDMCGKDIIVAGISWIESGIFPPNMNSTSISLIHKGDIYTPMKDQRPIALCNAIYQSILGLCL